MNNKLFLFAFVMLFSIMLASASWTERAVYSEEDLKVEIKSWWGYFEWMGIDQTVGTFELKSHTSVNEVKQVGAGEQVTMYYDFDFKEIYENGLGDVKFIDMKTGQEVKRDYEFVYLINETKEKSNCIEYLTTKDGQKDNSLTCLKYETDKYIEEVWTSYNYKLIPKEKIRIGIKVNSLDGDYLDGVWNIGGKDISKHAEWNASLETSLLAWYKLDETSGTTATDSFGSNDGTANSNYVFNSSTIGIINGGANFRNGEHRILIPSTIGLINKGLTVNFWVNVSSTSTKGSFIKVGYDNGIGIGVGNGKFDSNGNDLILLFESVRWVDTNHALGTGYKMITLVLDASGVPTLYVNGNSVGSYSGTISQQATGNTSIGGYGITVMRYSTSFMDEVGIWNRSLPVSEILQLYDSGNGMSYGSKDSSTINLTINKASPQTYGETINISCATNSNSTLKGYINNTEITLNTNILLGAGLWDIKCNVTENDYYLSATNSTNFTINKATPILTYLLNGVTNNVSLVYPNNLINASGSTNGGTLGMWMNNTDILSNNNLVVGLNVGYYKFEFNVTGTANYSDVPSVFLYGTINKSASVCDILFNTTSPINYPNLFIVYSNCDSVFNLKMNGTTITNNSIQSLSAGVYNFTVERTDTSNYSNTYDEELFTINKATPTGIITGTTPQAQGIAVNIEGTESNTGDGDVNYTLYRNGTYVSNPDLDTSLATGTYLYVYNTTGGANYSANSSIDTFLLDVEEIPAILVTLYSPSTGLITTETSRNFIANITAVGGAGLKNVTLYIWNSSNTVYETSTQTHSGFQDDVTFSITGIDKDSYIWNVLACSNNSEVGCTFGLSNRTLTVADSLIFINEGYGLYNYGAIGSKHLITFTPLLDSLDWCWVEYDGTNTTFFTDDMVLASSAGLSQTSDTSFVVGKTLTPPAKSYINNITFMGRSSSGSYTAYFYTTTYYNDSTISNSPEFSTALTSNTQYNVADAGTKYVDKVEIYYRIAHGAGTARMEEAYLNGYYMNCTNDVSSSLNVTLANPKTATVHTNDTAGNLVSQTFTWDYKILENSRTHETSVYETSSQTYSINLTANTSLTSVSLIYNGTSFSMTNQGSGIWSYTRDIPSTALGNNSITYRFVYAGTTINSTKTTYQFVSPILFGLCNATLTVPYVNFTFKDESNLSLIPASITSSWDYYLGSGTQTKSLVYTNASPQNSYAFCFNAPAETLYTIPSINYYATDYPTRIYSPGIVELTNTTLNKILYLLGTSDGSYATFITVTQSNTLVSGVSISITREILGETIIVAQGTTDSAGSFTAWLNPNFDHIVSATKTGFGFTSQTIRPTQSAYTLTLQTTTNYTYVSNIAGLLWGIFPRIGIVNESVSNNYGFNVSSELDNIVGCKIELLNNDKTIVLSTNEYITSDASFCSVMTTYTINSTYPKIKGRLLVDIGEGYQILEEDAFWALMEIDTTGMTISDWFKGITAMDLRYFNNSQQRREYAQILIFFLIAMIICAVMNNAGWDMQNPGGMVFLMGFMIWIASIPGFLYLEDISPFMFIDKYFVALIYSMFMVGYATRNT